MSENQPPYPSQPYPPQGYYPPQPPQKNSHTLRNVLLAVVLLFVLVVGGCLALIGGAANEVSKSIDRSENEVGGTKNPVDIQAGKAFSVRGFDYAAGWYAKNTYGDLDVRNLKVTNNRKDQDSAIVEIKFWQGNEVLALADCTTEPIAPGTTTRVSCISSDKLPAKFDRITINDSF